MLNTCTIYGNEYLQNDNLVNLNSLNVKNVDTSESNLVEFTDSNTSNTSLSATVSLPNPVECTNENIPDKRENISVKESLKPSQQSDLKPKQNTAERFGYKPGPPKFAVKAKESTKSRAETLKKPFVKAKQQISKPVIKHVTKPTSKQPLIARANNLKSLSKKQTDEKALTVSQSFYQSQTRKLEIVRAEHKIVQSNKLLLNAIKEKRPEIKKSIPKKSFVTKPDIVARKPLVVSKGSGFKAPLSSVKKSVNNLKTTEVKKSFVPNNTLRAIKSSFDRSKIPTTKSTQANAVNQVVKKPLSVKSSAKEATFKQSLKSNSCLPKFASRSKSQPYRTNVAIVGSKQGALTNRNHDTTKKPIVKRLQHVTVNKSKAPDNIPSCNTLVPTESLRSLDAVVKPVDLPFIFKESDSIPKNPSTVAIIHKAIEYNSSKTPYTNADRIYSFPHTISDATSVYSTKRRKRKPDKHSSIAPWMTSVDVVVEETVAGKNIFDQDRLSVAAKSLGQLGLMAAEAAENSPGNSLIDPKSPWPYTTSKVIKHLETSLTTPSPKMLDRVIYRHQTPLRSPFYRESTPLVQQLNNQQSIDPTPLCLVKTQYTPNVYPWTPFSTSKKYFISTPRAPKHRASYKCNQDLYRGIIQQQITTVKQALKKNGADPNNYFQIPVKQVPWILAPPFDYLKKTRTTDLFVHPLHLAVACSNAAIVSELLSYGACVNAVDEWGRHALHILSQPPVRSCHNLSDDSKTELAAFLFKDIPQRSAKQLVLIAEQFYYYGVDLDYETTEKLSLTDHIRIWSKIKREIMEGKISFIAENFENNDPIIDLNYSGLSSVPLPIIPQVSSLSLNNQDIKDSLLVRVPQELLDCLVILSGKARLTAIAPIVGLDVGVRKSSPSNSKYMPTLETPVRRHIPLYKFRMSVCSASGSIQSPYTILSQQTSVRSKRETIVHRPSIGITSFLMASVIESTEFSTPKMFLHPPANKQSDPKIIIHNNPKASSHIPEIKSKNDSKKTDTEIVDQNLIKFFEFAMKHRFHPALSHIWEYLGASFYPTR